MIDPIEYKLTGNEFKIVQYLKQFDSKQITASEMSKEVGMTSRSIRRIVSDLEHFKVIKINRFPPEKGERSTMANEYKLNDKKEWRI
jgi:DNA-binding MarR family transcriptional regulator